MRVIEDQPRRQVRVRERHGIQLVEGSAESVVVRRLVRESSTRAVDHDRAGQGALAVHEVRALLAEGGVAGDPDRRHPPGLAHVAELGPHAHGHPQSVTCVRRHGGGGGHGSAQEGGNEIGIPLESAGREDHAPTGADHLLASVDQQPDSGHASVFYDEVGGLGIHDRLDAEVEQGLDDRSDEGVAAAAQVGVDAPLQLFIRQLAGASTESGVGDLQVRAALAPRHFVLPCAQTLVAEQSRVERAPAVRLPARVLRVVVRVAGQEGEARLRGALEPDDGLARVIHEGLGHGRVHAVEGQRGEVGEGLLA